MSETNELTLKFSVETTFAETPSSPDMALLRITGETLKGTKQLVKSQEITGNPRTKDHIKTALGATGTISGEYSHGTYRKFFEGALRGKFLDCSYAAATISAAAADNSINDTAGGFLANGFAAGMWLKIAGFTGTAANNGKARITSVTATKIIIEAAAAGGITLVNDAAGETVTLTASTLRDATDTIIVNYAAGTISAAAADNSINDSANGFVTAGIIAGMAIQIAGFTGTVGNNGFATVVSVTAAKVVISGITLTNDAAGETVTVSGRCFKDSQVRRSFLLEKIPEDATDGTCISYRGARINTMRLRIQSQGIIGVEFDVLGQGEYAGTSTLDSSPTAASTSKICSASTNVGGLKEGGSTLSLATEEIVIEVNNNLETVNQIGDDKAADIAMGDLDVSGSFRVYFASKTLLDKFLAHTESSFDGKIVDPDSNVFAWRIPALYYADSNVNAPAKNQRIMQPLPFVAKEGPLAYQIQFDELAA